MEEKKCLNCGNRTLSTLSDFCSGMCYTVYRKGHPNYSDFLEAHQAHRQPCPMGKRAEEDMIGVDGFLSRPHDFSWEPAKPLVCGTVAAIIHAGDSARKTAINTGVTGPLAECIWDVALTMDRYLIRLHEPRKYRSCYHDYWTIYCGKFKRGVYHSKDLMRLISFRVSQIMPVLAMRSKLNEALSPFDYSMKEEAEIQWAIREYS